MSIAQRFVSMEYGPAPEDPKEALTWLEGHKRKFSHFIGGEWHAPQPAEYFDSNDPSNGELLAHTEVDEVLVATPYWPLSVGVLRAAGAVPVEVPLTTIDKIVSELRLPRVDFIKMDIEGAEVRALAGARATIARLRCS